MTEMPVIEDRAALAGPLTFLLQHEGPEVRVAADGREAPVKFFKVELDTMLLDPVLPGMSGTGACKNIRLKSSVPVIAATVRDTEIDKVAGLEIGVDDYMTKPYSSQELIARIRAVLYRSRHGDPNDTEDLYGEVLRGGPVVSDVERHVITVDGDDVVMPLKEFDLLEYLLHSRGRMLARGQLIDRVRGSDHAGDTRTLDAHTKRPRSKIECNPSLSEFLATACDLDYRLGD